MPRERPQPVFAERVRPEDDPGDRRLPRNVPEKRRAVLLDRGLSRGPVLVEANVSAHEILDAPGDLVPTSDVGMSMAAAGSGLSPQRYAVSSSPSESSLKPLNPTSRPDCA